MHRVTLCALAVWGTLSVAACDQPGTAPKLLAATGASPEVQQTFSLPVHATATAQLSGCNTSDGVSVALNGQLALARLDARLTFYNNEKGTHGATVIAQGEAPVIAAGAAITIPGEPSATQVQGDPHVFLQLVDGSDRALTGQASLGGCGASSTPVALDFTLPATARATVTCSNHPGASVTLASELVFDAGVAAKVMLQDPSTQDQRAAASGTLTLPIESAQGTLQFAKQPVNGGGGGNPWIYLQFLDGTGAPFGQEFLIGRCAQLT